MRPLTDEQRTQIMHYFPPRLGKFVVPGAGVFDAPFYCLIINVEWIGHLVGVLDALDQLDAWVGTSEEIEFARQEVRRLITGINPCEESNFVLRQNPDDPCLLEQSLDGGVNWSLAFDYSLCLPSASSAEILNTMQLGASGLEALRDLYDDTPESILRGTEDSPNLEDLLCYAIDMMVRSGCQTAADSAGDVNTLTNIIGIGLGVVAAGLAFFTGGASIAVWVGVMSAIVAAGGGLASLTKETLQDVGAQDDLICCINEALQGSDLSQATFSASVDGCDFPVDSNAFLLAQAFQTFTDNEDMYLAFLNFMHETDPFYQAGLYTCPCVDPLPCIDFSDLTNVTFIHGSIDVVNGNPASSGQSQTGVAGNSFPLGGSSGNTGVCVTIRYTFPETRTIKGVSFDYWHNQNKDNLCGLIVTYRDSVDGEIYRNSTTVTNAKSTWYPRSFSHEETNVKSITVSAFRVSSPAVTGTIRIDNICLDE